MCKCLSTLHQKKKGAFLTFSQAPWSPRGSASYPVLRAGGVGIRDQSTPGTLIFTLSPPAPTLTPSPTRNEAKHPGYVLALSTLPHKALPLQGKEDVSKRTRKAFDTPSLSLRGDEGHQGSLFFLKDEESKEGCLAVRPISPPSRN